MTNADSFVVASKTDVQSNVDARELAHYEKLATTWLDKNGPLWPLHKLHDLRTVYLQDALSTLAGSEASERRPLAQVQELDVGCGGGILSESLARLGADVHGIDVVQKNLSIAPLHAQQSNLSIRYEATTTPSLVARGASYDAVLCMEVVEHVPEFSALVHDCMKLVRPGGTIALATINRTPISWLFAIVGAEYILRWLPRGTHQWRKFVQPIELEQILTREGFSLSNRSGVKINPFTHRFSLTRNMAVNYMLLARNDGHEVN